MSSTIEEAIRSEATKLVKRHEAYAFNLANELRRREARSGLPQQKVLHRPSYWKVDNGFDPYYVRAHAKPIARSIEGALAECRYRPRPAIDYETKNADGSTRIVSVFQVADSAISSLTFKRLMEKNARHLSANAYAYRIDLSIHNAILHIASDLKQRNRLFVAEFDFAKYFDSISHGHIVRMLDDRRFFITARELHVIRVFLAAPSLKEQNYHIGPHEERTRGIPQGTSISLFLANLAAFPLDRRLERLGVGFARYADDTLIWSDNYADIGHATNLLEDAGREMGVDFNFMKSKGVSLLSPPGMPTEITAQNSLDYLGYSISQKKLSIRKRSITRIKRRISNLIFSNLLQEPKRGRFPSDRMLGPIDNDYPVLIYQLRRYLYGGLSEAKLLRFLTRQTPLIRYRGLMSFYPVVDDDDLLRSLDGWMLSSVVRALRLRSQLFSAYFPGQMPAPHGFSRPQLLQLRHNPGTGLLEDLRFPSFWRIGHLIRRAAATYGASVVANRKSSAYYST